MNEKSFVNNIDDETLAKMIDKTLIYRKTTKNRNIKTNLLKILPVAAAVVLFIGFINISPIFQIDDNTSIIPGNETAINVSDANNSDILHDDKVTTQLGEVIITTLKGYEPIQNEDGTITLPGGGTFKIDDNNSELYLAAITVESGYIINREDLGTLYNFSYAIYNTKPIFADETIVIELPNGTKWSIHGKNYNNPNIIKKTSGETIIEIFEKPNGEIIVNEGIVWTLYDEDWNDIFMNPENSDKLDHFKIFDYKWDAIYSVKINEWTDFVDYNFSNKETAIEFFGSDSPLSGWGIDIGTVFDRDSLDLSNDYDDWYGEGIWLNPDGTIADGEGNFIID